MRIEQAVEGSPYQPGDHVLLGKIIDAEGAMDLARVGQRGTVVGLEYECGCGQTYPTGPMIAVKFGDGYVGEYWQEELEAEMTMTMTTLAGRLMNSVVKSGISVREAKTLAERAEAYVRDMHWRGNKLFLLDNAAIELGASMGMSRTVFDALLKANWLTCRRIAYCPKGHELCDVTEEATSPLGRFAQFVDRMNAEGAPCSNCSLDAIDAAVRSAVREADKKWKAKKAKMTPEERKKGVAGERARRAKIRAKAEAEAEARPVTYGQGEFRTSETYRLTVECLMMLLEESVFQPAVYAAAKTRSREELEAVPPPMPFTEGCQEIEKLIEGIGKVLALVGQRA